MKKPVARPINLTPDSHEPPRAPRAFAPPAGNEPLESFTDEAELPLVAPGPRRRPLILRIALIAGSILLSLALGLAADSLVRNLFARYEWLGWVAIAALVAFVLAIITLIVREVASTRRLNKLDSLRRRARDILVSDDAQQGGAVIGELQMLYAPRADMARPRRALDMDMEGLIDGREMIHTAERTLMTPLDARARQLTAAASRRVAIVTAISPRALVDIGFVAFESIKLARAIAELYGARPGLIGSWRLLGAILGHLAVTGGVAMGDSVIQQLLGHGLAAKLSARLGEGLVNGMMTVRVGIAAMRVTRPLPFDALKQPLVMDFAADLARLNAEKDPSTPGSR